MQTVVANFMGYGEIFSAIFFYIFVVNDGGYIRCDKKGSLKFIFKRSPFNFDP